MDKLVHGCRLWMEVDLERLAGNYAVLRRAMRPDQTMIASIKGDGYGHGAVPVGTRLAELGVEMLATGSLHDALALRAAEISTPLLMFGGVQPAAMPTLLAHDLTPTVHTPALAEAVNEAADAAGAGPTGVFVKVDSGLGRLGLALAHARRAIERMARLAHIEIAGIYTHLPFGDDAGRSWALERLERFEALIHELRMAGIEAPVVQALSSAGLLAGLRDPFSATSPGHLLFGLTPGEASTHLAAWRTELAPVMRGVKSRLIQITRHRAATRIGSGGQVALPAGAVVGVVPVGLTDGYRNAAPGATAHATVRGQTATVLRVNLEHTILDLSGVSSITPGDEVVLVGAAGDGVNSIERVGRAHGVGDLDVLMSFAGRAARVYRT